MAEKTFKIKRNIFERRKLTTLQHKLRVVLKCYTVREFILHENNSFDFKISHKINGLKLDSTKPYSGSFIIKEVNDQEIELKITI